MKKQLLVLGLTSILIIVGLCGCSSVGANSFDELPADLQVDLNNQQKGI